MDKDVRQRVFKIISQLMKVPITEVNEDSSPTTIAEWNSLMHINLVLALEQEFKVSLTDEMIIEMLNVGLIIEIISSLLNGAGNVR